MFFRTRACFFSPTTSACAFTDRWHILFCFIQLTTTRIPELFCGLFLNLSFLSRWLSDRFITSRDSSKCEGLFKIFRRRNIALFFPLAGVEVSEHERNCILWTDASSPNSEHGHLCRKRNYDCVCVAMRRSGLVSDRLVCIVAS